MKRYEYIDVILNPLKDNRETLNELGAQGWELKVVLPLIIKEPLDGCVTRYRDVTYGAYTFAREIGFVQ